MLLDDEGPGRGYRGPGLNSNRASMNALYLVDWIGFDVAPPTLQPRLDLRRQNGLVEWPGRRSSLVAKNR